MWITTGCRKGCASVQAPIFLIITWALPVLAASDAYVDTLRVLVLLMLVASASALLIGMCASVEMPDPQCLCYRERESDDAVCCERPCLALNIRVLNLILAAGWILLVLLHIPVANEDGWAESGLIIAAVTAPVHLIFVCIVHFQVTTLKLERERHVAMPVVEDPWGDVEMAPSVLTTFVQVPVARVLHPGAESEEVRNLLERKSKVEICYAIPEQATERSQVEAGRVLILMAETRRSSNDSITSSQQMLREAGSRQLQDTTTTPSSSIASTSTQAPVPGASTAASGSPKVIDLSTQTSGGMAAPDANMDPEVVLDAPSQAVSWGRTTALLPQPPSL